MIQLDLLRCGCSWLASTIFHHPFFAQSVNNWSSGDFGHELLPNFFKRIFEITQLTGYKIGSLFVLF
ncbi:MAG: hypothetical protein ACI85U_004327 [Candidatus Promineifilaceae bacterium]|jgi:hypothetical protein